MLPRAHQPNTFDRDSTYLIVLLDILIDGSLHDGDRFLQASATAHSTEPLTSKKLVFALMLGV